MIHIANLGQLLYHFLNNNNWEIIQTISQIFSTILYTLFTTIVGEMNERSKLDLQFFQTLKHRLRNHIIYATAIAQPLTHFRRTKGE